MVSARDGALRKGGRISDQAILVNGHPVPGYGRYDSKPVADYFRVAGP